MLPLMKPWLLTLLLTLPLYPLTLTRRAPSWLLPLLMVLPLYALMAAVLWSLWSLR